MTVRKTGYQPERRTRNTACMPIRKAHEGPDDVVRIDYVCQKRGDSRAGVYADMGRRTWPQPIRISRQSIGWLRREVDALCAARAAGATEQQLRDLVAQLTERRKAAAKAAADAALTPPSLRHEGHVMQHSPADHALAIAHGEQAAESLLDRLRAGLGAPGDLQATLAELPPAGAVGFLRKLERALERQIAGTASGGIGG